MAGLVAYASSDEEDVAEDLPQGKPTALDTAKTAEVRTVAVEQNGVHINEDQSHPHTDSASTKPSPAIGPTIPDDSTSFELPEDAGINTEPQSPYSANRALLRDLTLPTVPNYDIPQSPPGSPVESTNAKFKQFLKLKREGVHFNEKLAHSAAMKNPSVMQKLLDFVDLDESELYLTTLPKDLWDPTSFPEAAFKEELVKGQQRIAKRKEEERASGPRESIDFVSATTSSNTSRNGTPGMANRTGKSAAERVMAGLDRGNSGSSPGQSLKRKSRFDT